MSEVDTNSEEFKQALSVATESLRKEFEEKDSRLAAHKDELVSEKREIEARLKETQGTLDKYKGLGDVDNLKDVISRFEDSEEAKMIKEGKIDDVINGRIDKQRTQWEAKLKAEADSNLSLKEQLESRDKVISGLVVDGAIQTTAASIEDFRGEAMEDVVARGRNVWKVEDGKAVAYGPDGNQLFNAKGEPLAVNEWIDSMRESAPHYFRSAKGTNAKGGGGKASSNQKRSDMSLADKSAFIREHGQEEYFNLPE